MLFYNNNNWKVVAFLYLYSLFLLLPFLFDTALSNPFSTRTNRFSCNWAYDKNTVYIILVLFNPLLSLAALLAASRIRPIMSVLLRYFKVIFALPSVYLTVLRSFIHSFNTFQVQSFLSTANPGWS